MDRVAMIKRNDIERQAKGTFYIEGMVTLGR
jgi:hypothetical protein